MRKHVTTILVIAAVLTSQAPAWAQGCAMCRTALESSPEGKLLASSFAHGILMMLFLPYTLFAIFSFIVYRAFRKKSRQRYENG